MIWSVLGAVFVVWVFVFSPWTGDGQAVGSLPVCRDLTNVLVPRKVHRSTAVTGSRVAAGVQSAVCCQRCLRKGMWFGRGHPVHILCVCRQPLSRDSHLIGYKIGCWLGLEVVDILTVFGSVMSTCSWCCCWSRRVLAALQALPFGRFALSEGS